MSEEQPPHLLIVDDEKINTDAMGLRLGRRGYRVSTASNGVEALAVMANEPIDLVISDVMMPIMNGLQLVREIRSTTANDHIPIIMATAQKESEEVVDALELGADDYVTKPVDFPVLLARVRSQLRRKAAAKPKASQSPSAVTHDPTKPASPGSVVDGRYKLVKKLGEGAFGVVWQAQHLALEKSVAIKLMKMGPNVTETDVLRFRREGKTAGQLEHPSSLQIFDCGILSGSIAYLAMELLTGESAQDELDRTGPMTPDRATAIVQPMCEVLAEAHALNLIHRDIKPDNIFVHQSARGEVIKLTDFGTAKFVGGTHQQEQLTVDGRLLGTPAFMAPELFLATDPDSSADVFALGVTLYMLVTGKLPYGSLNLEPLAQAVQQVRDKAEPLADLVEGVDEDFTKAVMRAISKEPEERPTAQELGQLLGKIEPAPPEPEAAPVEEAKPSGLLAALRSRFK